MFLHKLGYSPTQYSLHLIPNSSLWAGVTKSSLTALSLSNRIAHKNIGTLLFEHGRHFSLVLAANSEERDNDVITKGEEYSTPKRDTLSRDVGESGYSTNHSSIAAHANDVIMMSSPPRAECTKLNESCSTIIVSDSEDETEDPLATRSCALPGLFSHRLHPQPIDEKCTCNIQSTIPYFLPPRPKHSSTERAPINMDTNCSSKQKQHKPSSRDKVIVISSSDETDLPSLSTFGGQQSDVRHIHVSGRSPQSSDEGIVLDSRWEGSSRTGYGSRVENKTLLAATCMSPTESGPSQHSVLSGDGELLRQQKAAEHSVVVKCSGYELTQADLRTLEPHQWLNDQVSQSSSTFIYSCMCSMLS